MTQLNKTHAQKPAPEELTQTVLYGDTDAVKDLLDRGANVDEKDKIGQTPLILAVKKGRIEIVRLLIGRGAGLEEKDDDGWTALMYMLPISPRVDILRLLVEAGANVNARYGEGYTPLMKAVMYCDKDSACLLIDNGAEVEAEAEDGETALRMARERGHTDIEEMLLEAIGARRLKEAAIVAATAAAEKECVRHSAVAAKQERLRAQAQKIKIPKF